MGGRGVGGGLPTRDTRPYICIDSYTYLYLCVFLCPYLCFFLSFETGCQCVPSWGQIPVSACDFAIFVPEANFCTGKTYLHGSACFLARAAGGRTSPFSYHLVCHGLSLAHWGRTLPQRIISFSMPFLVSGMLKYQIYQSSAHVLIFDISIPSVARSAEPGVCVCVCVGKPCSELPGRLHTADDRRKEANCAL